MSLRKLYSTSLTKGADLVVLVHGFWGHRVQLLPMAAALARNYNVLNYGYSSRADFVDNHAESFIDSVRVRIENINPRNVHFVTHSFGGVVLRCAYGLGLQDVIPEQSRTKCVLIGPPLRGASLARTLEDMSWGVPSTFRKGMRGLARLILGEKAGLQLRTESPDWFEKVGHFPKNVDVLVVAGSLGRINPVLSETDSDGIVAVNETMLDTPHRRLYFTLPHNTLLMSPQVIQHVSKFLQDNDVGIPHPGEPLPT